MKRLQRHFDSRLNQWEFARHLWTKFVGVSDEYKMLRDKWIFLCDDLSPALPDLRVATDSPYSTFDVLDQQVENIDKRFRDVFGFRRDRPDKLSDFKEGKYEEYETLEHRISDLSAYLGLMKLAFYQRTVSVEIPHITSGYPHSPERTIGNEQIYVAADKVAESYVRCLNYSEDPEMPKWDGFITYIPPVTDELSLGAFCDMTEYGLARLFLSERHKPTISTYLILAHEVGHIPVHGSGRRRMREEYGRLARTIRSKAIEERNKIDQGCIAEPQHCLYFLGEEDSQGLSPVREEIWLSTFDQIFADVFGLLIGGPTTSETLLNETVFSSHEQIGLANVEREVLLRQWAIAQYLKRAKISPERFALMVERLQNLIDKLAEEEEEHAPCLDCLKRLGQFIGKSIFEKERKEKTTFSKFIKKDYLFKMTSREEKNVINALVQRSTCAHVDPRKILHCYFLASQEAAVFEPEIGEHPSFASTLHSLAYNTFAKSEKARQSM